MRVIIRKRYSKTTVLFLPLSVTRRATSLLRTFKGGLT